MYRYAHNDIIPCVRMDEYPCLTTVRVYIVIVYIYTRWLWSSRRKSVSFYTYMCHIRARPRCPRSHVYMITLKNCECERPRTRLANEFNYEYFKTIKRLIICQPRSPIVADNAWVILGGVWYEQPLDAFYQVYVYRSTPI